jgi:hypothetical protein
MDCRVKPGNDKIARFGRHHVAKLFFSAVASSISSLNQRRRASSVPERVGVT